MDQQLASPLAIQSSMLTLAWPCFCDLRAPSGGHLWNKASYITKFIGAEHASWIKSGNDGITTGSPVPPPRFPLQSEQRVHATCLGTGRGFSVRLPLPGFHGPLQTNICKKASGIPTKQWDLSSRLIRAKKTQQRANCSSRTTRHWCQFWPLCLPQCRMEVRCKGQLVSRSLLWRSKQVTAQTLTVTLPQPGLSWHS